MNHAKTPLNRLFEARLATGEASWFSLPGGAALFEAGEVADHIYLLHTGRLGAFRPDQTHEPQFLGVIRPGEPAGEMSVISGAPHSGHLVALRDSEVYALPREDFLLACEADPALLTEVARLMIQRSRQATSKTSPGEPSVYGFLPVGTALPLRPMIEQMAAEIIRLGYSVAVIGKEGERASREWFSTQERDHDFVLCFAEADEGRWQRLVSGQVDRLFRVGRGDSPPPEDGRLSPTDPLGSRNLVDLILVHEPETERPVGSEAWMLSTGAGRLFHLRRDHDGDLQRIVRGLTGQSVGLVLSGGGARAYAHVGVIKALRERGIPIDFVGGVSMGAVIAAGLAMGWNDTELDTRIQQAFVRSSPLDDIAFPMLAMTRGRKVAKLLLNHFSDTQFADLWLPFFCVSSNLTTGAYHVHRRGLLRDALRASISLPGILPPATLGNDVLVDGAVLKNFPVDVMRASQLGPIIGVDVSRGRSITASDIIRPASMLKWILTGQWRKGPPIVSVLMRAATVSSGRDILAARDASDVLVTPDVGGVEIRDWTSYGPAVEAGHAAMIAALDKLTLPVMDLRRRPSRATLPAQD